MIFFSLFAFRQFVLASTLCFFFFGEVLRLKSLSNSRTTEDKSNRQRKMTERCSSPTWSAYEGVNEEREFADLIASAKDSECNPLSRTLRHAARKIGTLARGAQGVVYMASMRNRPELGTVAIKRLFSNEDNCYSSQSTLVNSEREIQLLQRFAARPASFAHVVQLHDVIAAPSRETCLVLEYCPFDLSTVAIRSHKRSSRGGTSWADILGDDTIRYLIREVLIGIKELHNENIVHRDIKLSNILISSEGNIKLADFGCAKETSADGSATPAAIRTTLLYRSPEGLLGPVSNTVLSKQDIWGVGVIAAELVRGKHLFAAHGELAMISQVFSLVGTPTVESWPEFFDLQVCQSFQFAPSPNVIREKFTAQGASGSDLVDFLVQSLTANPMKRMSVDEALRHPYISMQNRSMSEEAVSNYYDDARRRWVEFVTLMIREKDLGDNGHQRRLGPSQRMMELLAGEYDDGDEEDDDDDDVNDPF